ncbi:MAG: DUF541 domain-containing protein [Anaerolineae bacterium]|nr:DUF541 domain-containing protein [Anaerolineae bacterium]NIN95778.1 DUF541 domain-containing protein [Anaerolineae bacterium]NIQ78753.1 DUF541 domain-containing protein [Anaerolineae bacterium]
MSKTAKIMGAVGLLLLALVLVLQLAMVVPGLGGARAGTEERGIMVMGEGKASAEPDLTVITIGVETRAATADGAAEENSERMAQVMDALQRREIADEDIRTVDYSIRAEIDWDDDERRILGYVVSNSVSVKIRDVDQVGDVLDAVTDAGANNIYGIQFTFDDPSELREAARAEAMGEAQSKAQALASLAGVGLGKPRMISESFVEPVPFYMERVYAAPAEAGGVVPVSPGQLEVRVQVQVTYDIR